MTVSLVEVVEFFMDRYREEGLIKRGVTVTDVDTDGLPEFVYVQLSDNTGFRINITLPKSS